MFEPRRQRGTENFFFMPFLFFGFCISQHRSFRLRRTLVRHCMMHHLINVDWSGDQEGRSIMPIVEQACEPL
jgi:hypothetical protein